MKEFWVIVSENNEASWGLIAKCGELARERGLLLRAYRVPSGGPEHTEAVRKTLEAMYYRSGPEGRHGIAASLLPSRVFEPVGRDRFL